MYNNTRKSKGFFAAFTVALSKRDEFPGEDTKETNRGSTEKIYFWMIEKLYKPKTESCTSLLTKKYNELTTDIPLPLHSSVSTLNNFIDERSTRPRSSP